MAGLDEALKIHPLDEIKRGKQQQQGFGMHTLCERCNSVTGDWYAKEYTRWAYQAHAYLQLSDGEPLASYPYHGMPLRFIKQAITIMFSVIGPDGLSRLHPDLVKFVLDKRRKYISGGVRLFAYYNPATRMRNHSFSAQLNIETHRMEVFAEFAAYPFGFVLLDEGSPPDDRLTEITWLAEFGYDDYMDVWLKLPSFPVLAPLPGNYFTTSEARRMRKPE